MLNSIHNGFGLDISDQSIKLVHLKRLTAFGKKIKIALANYGVIPLPSGIIQDGKIKDKKKLASAIAKLIKNNLARKLQSRGVVANLPDSKTFLTTVLVPDAATNLEEAVLRAVEKNIPLPPAKIYYDYKILETSRDKKTRKILIGAAEQDIAESYTEVLEEAGLTPVSLEIEPLATLRALTDFNVPLSDQLAVIDLGATRSSLIIYDQGSVELALSLPISGNSITETITASLKVSFLEAEKIKIRCGFDVRKCDLELRQLVNKLITDLTEKIRGAFRFYQDKTGREQFRPTQILLCGGGANLEKIDKVLSEKLKIKVRLGNPLINLVPDLSRAFPRGLTSDGKARDKLKFVPNPLSLTTAIGLALLPIISLLENDKS